MTLELRPTSNGETKAQRGTINEAPAITAEKLRISFAFGGTILLNTDPANIPPGYRKRIRRHAHGAGATLGATFGYDLAVFAVFCLLRRLFSSVSGHHFIYL